MKLELTSAVFANGQVIPTKYTCEGQDISPPLKWRNAPEETQSFALIVEDPDAAAGTFDHWILFNVPAATTELAESMPTSALLDHGMKQGLNGFNRIGYGGPCPPKQDASHRYFFHLYALDIILAAQEGASKKELKHEMEGHILAEGTLLGTYARTKVGEKTSGA
jgi:Raf kinase inhibitor-like YbhB/YbcL family protein